MNLGVTVPASLPGAADEVIERGLTCCRRILLHMLKSVHGTPLTRPTAGPVLLIVPGSWASADIRKSLYVASSALSRLWSFNQKQCRTWACIPRACSH